MIWPIGIHIMNLHLCKIADQALAEKCIRVSTGCSFEQIDAAVRYLNLAEKQANLPPLRNLIDRLKSDLLRRKWNRVAIRTGLPDEYWRRQAILKAGIHE